jgi:catechol 2,3-dioxygenase-like lactoylglutathione lyase family enzyme
MVRFTGVIGSFTVGDAAAARAFYASTLGLDVTEALPGRPDPMWIRVGDGPGVFVYVKPDHVPAGFTVLNLTVDDIGLAVDELTNRGIEMQRFDAIPQDDRGIFHGEGHAIAWFTDPAGNSLSVVKLTG